MLYLAFGSIPVSLGLISRLIEPDAEGGILQLMAAKYLTPTMAVIFVVSFTSIVVSTATSAVLAPATILGHNVLSRIAIFKNRGLVLDRFCVFLISMGGLALAFSGQSKMALLDLALSMQLVALFIPLTMGLYGRPRSSWAAILAMGFGITCFMARWLPEQIFLVQPDSFEGEYPDYVAVVPGLGRVAPRHADDSGRPLRIWCQPRRLFRRPGHWLSFPAHQRPDIKRRLGR